MGAAIIKKILTALALVLSATAANAATYTFDLYTTGSSFPATAPVNAGSGTFSLTNAQTMATAKTNLTGFSVYEPATFDLKLAFTNYNWTDTELTIGRVNVSYNLTTATCVITPSGCVPGPPPPQTDSISVAFIGGTFNVRSPDVISDGNLSQANIDAVFSNATGGSMTLSQTSPYGVPSGPVNLTMTNIRALTAPVPEPSEWAMMTGGLAIVSGMARRRRSR